MRRGWTRGGVVALVVIVLLAVPYLVNPYQIHVLDVAVVFAILAMGLGIALGLGGQINLAQVAFFGIGSYAVAILTTDKGWGFWVAAVVAVVASLLFGLVVGIPALRVQSHYLGIVTLGLALAFTSWVTNSGITKGAAGISNIPVPPLFGLDLSSEYFYYYLEIVVFALGLGFAQFVKATRLGRRLRAMRDDVTAASALGSDVRFLRLLAFGLSSVYGGVAGVLYAGLIRYVSPDSFTITTMFLLLAMVIIGGRQSIVGCVVGAIVLSLVREALVDFSTYAQLGYGAVVVFAVVFAPTGLAGVPGRIRALRRRGPVQRAALRDFSAEVAQDVLLASASQPYALRVDGIAKHFSGVKALQDVTLHVEPGTIKGIVGPNGSGKTTLLNVISGLYTPTAGRYLLDDHDVTAASPASLSHSGVARTFQNLRLFGDLSVLDNLLTALDRTRTGSVAGYLLWPFGVVAQERRLRERAQALLSAFGIEDYAEEKPTSLPYGIQRRVELARAVSTRPRILLLDEPAAGLNGQEVDQLRRIVRAIRDTGVSVVLVEHNMGLVMSLCDEVAVLANGRVIADGAPSDVVAQPDVIEAYLGDASQFEDLVPSAGALGAAPRSANDAY